MSEIVARSVNAAIVKLVPDEAPVGTDGIKNLRERFRVATEAVNNDRNWVRAHRYEKTRAKGPTSTYAIPLHQYMQHVEYLIDDVYQACLAIKALLFETEIKEPQSDAADLADLVFHGSIEARYGRTGSYAKLHIDDLRTATTTCERLR